METLHLHASTGSSRGGPGMGHLLISCSRLPRRAAPHDVPRAAARHQASPGRSV